MARCAATLVTFRASRALGDRDSTPLFQLSGSGISLLRSCLRCRHGEHAAHGGVGTGFHICCSEQFCLLPNGDSQSTLAHLRGLVPAAVINHYHLVSECRILFLQETEECHGPA